MLAATSILREQLPEPRVRVVNVVDLMQLDRLVQDVIDRLPQPGERGDYLKQTMQDKLVEHNRYIDQPGGDMPEVESWRWGGHR